MRLSNKLWEKSSSKIQRFIEMFLLIDNLIIYISDELIETLCSAPGSPDTKALFFLFYEQVQIMM